MSKAMIVLNADCVVHGPVKVTTGVVQQETRLYEDGRCTVVMLITHVPGSETHTRAMEAFRRAFPEHHPDDLRNVRDWTVQSDVEPAAS